jgi:hypothetical protein
VNLGQNIYHSLTVLVWKKWTSWNLNTYHCSSAVHISKVKILRTCTEPLMENNTNFRLYNLDHIQFRSDILLHALTPKVYQNLPIQNEIIECGCMGILLLKITVCSHSVLKRVLKLHWAGNVYSCLPCMSSHTVIPSSFIPSVFIHVPVYLNARWHLSLRVFQFSGKGLHRTCWTLSTIIS